MVKRTTQGIAHRGVEVFLLLFLTLALSMSLAFTPGALAFAEVSGQGDEKESLPVEQLVESEKEGSSKLDENLSEIIDQSKTEGDVSPADELSAVNPDSKKEAVLATNEVLSQSDVASDELAPLAGGKIGQGSSGTRNAILYDLYDDGTCIAVGFDYPTQASGSAWTAMFPEDGQITLTDELSSGNGGTYTLVAIADNFNFDETKGVHVPCTRIRISETVVSIGDNAFRDAKAEVLTFPATGALEEIGEYAFYSCSIANGTGALNY